MARSEAYVKYGDLPKNAAIEIIPSLTNRIKWKENCKVIDIGCGPGNVTRDILLPNLPKSIKVIVGIDKCPDFIKYAKNHYEWSPIMSFKLMDIVEDDVPSEFEEYFDYAVSFLCFHQFNDHKTAFNNIGKMLKPSGEVICYFPITTSAFPLYQALANHEKWKPYFCDYQYQCSPYKDSSNVREDIETSLAAVGFKVSFFQLENRKHRINVRDAPRTYFTSGAIMVPDDLMDELMVDIVSTFRTLDLIRMDEESEEYIDFSYTLIILHLIKDDSHIQYEL